MSHGPEEWSKIWRKTDLLFQKWQEYGEFWIPIPTKGEWTEDGEHFANV